MEQLKAAATRQSHVSAGQSDQTLLLQPDLQLNTTTEKSAERFSRTFTDKTLKKKKTYTQTPCEYRAKKRDALTRGGGQSARSVSRRDWETSSHQTYR